MLISHFFLYIYHLNLQRHFTVIAAAVAKHSRVKHTVRVEKKTDPI